MRPSPTLLSLHHCFASSLITPSQKSPQIPCLVAQELGSEYAKEQWAMETLSHHFLPLIRYRRAKARAAGVPFTPELAGPLR